MFFPKERDPHISSALAFAQVFLSLYWAWHLGPHITVILFSLDLCELPTKLHVYSPEPNLTENIGRNLMPQTDLVSAA